jgi:hypothetical protein
MKTTIHSLKTKRCIALVILLVTMVTVGVVGLAPATAGNAQVPFKAHITGAPAWTSPTTVVTHGTGTATGVGRFVNSGDIVVDAPSGTCANGTPAYPTVQIETLTAANGDQLVLRMLVVVCEIAPDSWEGAGTWSVVSGTGRFEGMTGHGTVNGLCKFVPPDCDIDFVGTISRP